MRIPTTSAACSGIDLGQSEQPFGWAMIGVCQSACRLYASGQSRLPAQSSPPVRWINLWPFVLPLADRRTFWHAEKLGFAF